MNNNIRELLRSNDIDDVLLGIELLHKTGNEEYFRRDINDERFVPRLLFHALLFDDEGHPTRTSDPYEAIDNYCKQNNYWIYE